MAKLMEDNIDFRKLEKELDLALEADAKYSRENDAKFRAVHQKVGTYEEFRDIVKASHLKPLEKKDKISEDSKFQQPWNIHASGKKEETPVGDTIKMSNSIPSTSHEFGKEWKRFKSVDEKYNFLKIIGYSNLTKLFKTEIAFGLLGEIVSVLSENQNTDMDFVLNLLEGLTKAGRFQLSVQFLSEKEKKIVDELLKNLDTKSEEIQRERILSLRNLYSL